MKRSLLFTAVMLILAVGAADAQRYHYDVDEQDVQTDGYDDQQDTYWRYREQYRPSGESYGRPPSAPAGGQSAGYYQPPPPPQSAYNDARYDDYNYTYAYPFFFEISANDADVELAFGHVWEENARNFRTTFGASVLYNDDEYEAFNLLFLLGNRIDRFRMDIGFKGVFGTVEKDNDTEGDISAVGFYVTGAWDLPVVDFIFGLPLDFELGSSFTIAPDPLAFEDLESYGEFRFTVGLYVLEQKKGLVFLGYRSIDTSFTTGDGDDGGDEWDIQNDSVLFGYRFIF
jgi:hypothetical protein